MSDALYPERLVVRVDPGDVDGPAGPVGPVEPVRRDAPADAPAGAPVDLVGTQAGPAGSSAIELPDGTVWEVDHADPSQLVQISTSTAVARARSLVALIGQDRFAMASSLAGRAGAESRVLGPEDPAGSQSRRSGRRRAPGESTAMRVGRLIVLTDLLHDPGLDPLAQLSAGIELLLELHDRPKGEDAAVALVRSGAAVAERRVAHLASEIDDDELFELGSQNRGQLARVRRAARSLAGRVVALQLPLEQLIVRIDEVGSLLDDIDDIDDIDSHAADGFGIRYSDARGGAFVGAPAALRISEAPMAAEEPLAVEDFRQVERIEPALLRVTVARDLPGRRVRVLRADGLVLLAVAPLLADGLLQTAELAVPPDVADDDLLVEVIDGETFVAACRPIELVHDAVRAGRRAARAARLGDPAMTRRRWMECAALWEQAGDGDRSTLARALADEDPSDRQIIPFLCDAVTELAVRSAQS